jgi:hypothetical protein
MAMGSVTAVHPRSRATDQSFRQLRALMALPGLESVLESASVQARYFRD